MSSNDRKAMTLRLFPEQADALEVAAQVNGVTVAEEVRVAIWARLDALRADPEFQARLRDHLERNREILKGAGLHVGGTMPDTPAHDVR